MLSFLDTQGVFAKLNYMIKNARRFIALVSPFINLDPEQIVLLKNASEMGVPITIIYRLDDSKTTKRMEKISELPGIQIIGCPELHAKIYATEEGAIMASRNLTTRQEGCSIEVGVFFDHYEEIYIELINTIKNLRRIEDSKTITDNRTEKLAHEGFCIRCRKKINLSLEEPLCPSCYEKWSRYSNTTYMENYCHFCGKMVSGITFEKPMEYDCFLKYIEQ